VLHKLWGRNGFSRQPRYFRFGYGDPLGLGQDLYGQVQVQKVHLDVICGRGSFHVVVFEVSNALCSYGRADDYVTFVLVHYVDVMHFGGIHHVLGELRPVGLELFDPLLSVQISGQRAVMALFSAGHGARLLDLGVHLHADLVKFVESSVCGAARQRTSHLHEHGADSGDRLIRVLRVVHRG